MSSSIPRHIAIVGVVAILWIFSANVAAIVARSNQPYEYKKSRDLVALVNSAATLVHAQGEVAFAEFRISGSRWRHGHTYIFVLDSKGNLLVHPDPAMQGRNEMDLKDVNGRPIVRGLINAATEIHTKPGGRYHYRWPVPGKNIPEWKSSYVRLVTAPSGKKYIVGSGIYDKRLERVFVVDMVKDAVGEIEQKGRAAFPLFHDPTGPFIFKDAYIFVDTPQGVELVSGGFPKLEGENGLNLKDTQGKMLVRESLKVVRSKAPPGWTTCGLSRDKPLHCVSRLMWLKRSWETAG